MYNEHFGTDINVGTKTTVLSAFAMTEEYMKNHFDEIISHESEVEARLVDAECTITGLTADNKSYIDGFRNAGEHVVIIDDDYEETIEALLQEGSDPL